MEVAGEGIVENVVVLGIFRWFLAGAELLEWWEGQFCGCGRKRRVCKKERKNSQKPRSRNRCGGKSGYVEGNRWACGFLSGGVF